MLCEKIVRSFFGLNERAARCHPSFTQINAQPESELACLPLMGCLPVEVLAPGAVELVESGAVAAEGSPDVAEQPVELESGAAVEAAELPDVAGPDEELVGAEELRFEPVLPLIPGYV